MKVLDSHLAATSSASAPASITREPAAGPATGRPAGGDRVELSGFAGKLGATLGAQSQERAARVAAFERDYQSGRYQVDARATSRALVSEALATQSSDQEI